MDSRQHVPVWYFVAIMFFMRALQGVLSSQHVETLPTDHIESQGFVTARVPDGNLVSELQASKPLANLRRQKHPLGRGSQRQTEISARRPLRVVCAWRGALK